MKPKILVIEPYCPTPSDSGGKTRINHTLRFLSRHYSIDLLAFFHHPSEVGVNKRFFEKLNIHPIFFPTSKRGLLSFFVTGTPYWFAPWHSPKLAHHLQKTDSKKYSAILVEQSQLLYLVDHIPGSVKSVFVAHDVSTVTFWRRLRDVNILKKVLHFPRFLEVFIYELCYLKKFKHVVAVSPKDAYYLKLLFRLKSVSIIENGIKKTDFIAGKHNTYPVRLGYLGSTNHTPNRKAIDFIVNNIYPSLNSKKFTVNIGGHNNIQLSTNRISYLGFIASTKRFFEQIDILVAPIFSGSGSRIKILESLAFGRPVITTSVGAEGLNIDSPLLTIIPPKKEKSSITWVNAINNQPTTYNTTTLTKLDKQLIHHLWQHQLKKYLKILS